MRHSKKCEQVFSDEFEEDGRTFNDGNDPRWTAINKNDCKFVNLLRAYFCCTSILTCETDTNAALHFYSNENAFTSNGVLNLTTVQKINAYKAFDEKKKTFYMDKKYIQTGMVQGWNKFCFIGGIVEISAKLPAITAR